MKSQEFKQHLQDKAKQPKDFIPTGITELDDLIDGLYPGKLYTIGGWPGTGKTTFTQNIIVNINKNTRVSVFDTESSKSIYFEKLVSILSLVPYKEIRLDPLLALPRLEPHLSKLDNYETNVLDFTSPSFEDIEREVSKNKPEVVIIDYLQNMNARFDKYTNTANAYSDLIRRLEALSKQYNTRIVLLSQLRRPQQGFENSKPTKFDLKETGKLAEASHVVILLHNDNSGLLEVNVAKNRDGLVGSFKLRGLWSSNKLLGGINGNEAETEVSDQPSG